MTRDERILEDLAEHLREKMLYAIDDYISRCRSVELSQKTVMSELMITLVRLTATFAATQFNISPGDFADVMSNQFEHVMRSQEDD